jgi:hydrogenase nickel incorporation protein HypA/HybF
MLSEGTLAQGAELHFKRIQTEMRCMDCQAQYHPSEGDLSCPECRSRNVQIVAGEEFFVDSIEVELDGDNPSEDSGENG